MSEHLPLIHPRRATCDECVTFNPGKDGVGGCSRLGIVLAKGAACRHAFGLQELRLPLYGRAK